MPTKQEFPVVSQSSDRPERDCDLAELVLAAKEGDGRAWNVLVRRYTPLVESVARRYRLSFNDADDVSQVVWLRLFENLTSLREVRALPGWIKTTTKREILRLLVGRLHAQPVDPSVLVSLDRRESDLEVDDRLLRFERGRAIVDGLAELAPDHRNFLILLHAEPRPSYLEISATLGMPPGSIGPTRARCLEKLRKTEAIRTFLRSAGNPEYFAAS